MIHDVVSVWGPPSPSMLEKFDTAPSYATDAAHAARLPADVAHSEKAPSEFIFGRENALLSSALTAIGVRSWNVLQSSEAELKAEFDADKCNPLLLHGPSGSGKSHLLHAIVSGWRDGSAEHRNAEHRARKAILVTGADFARFHSMAMQADAMTEFRAKYRKVGLLAIEDLDGLAGKTAAQEELIGAIDSLLEAKEPYDMEHAGDTLDADSQTYGDAANLAAVASAGCAPTSSALVVASLRCNPLETTSGEFLPGLVSRLCQGLTIPLVMPSLATRRALVRLFARKWQVRLDDQAADLLAEELPLSAGALQGAVQRLQHAKVAARASGSPAKREIASAVRDPHDNPIDAAFVSSFLEKHAHVRQPSLRSIVAAVSRCYQIKAGDLKGAGRRQSVVMARGMAMYLARQLTDASLEDVGAHFGGRDHTTVMHACRKLARLVEDDPDVRRSFAQLCAELSAASHAEALS